MTYEYTRIPIGVDPTMILENKCVSRTSSVGEEREVSCDGSVAQYSFFACKRCLQRVLQLHVLLHFFFSTTLGTRLIIACKFGGVVLLFR